MKIEIASLLVVPVVLLAAGGCLNRGSLGISGIPPRRDKDHEWIEYRVVEINGATYTATRSEYWPGDGEKWDLVRVGSSTNPIPVHSGEIQVERLNVATVLIETNTAANWIIEGGTRTNDLRAVLIYGTLPISTAGGHNPDGHAGR